MPAQVISGKEVAAQIRRELKSEVEQLTGKGIQPGLAVILVGDDPASHSYVKGKEKASIELGFYSEIHRLEASVSEENVLALISKLNGDPKIHGILVQLPLPGHISEKKVIQAINPDKDVDGFHPENVGNMYIGLPAFLPCTPHGVIQMLKRSDVDIKGKHAVVLGRSNIVGKPMAQLLLAEDATVTICHSRTIDLPAITRQADILIAAVGKAGMVTADMVKPGAVVIDVGVNRVEGKLVGDCQFDEVSRVASLITPVPGGVGPMTITMLMYNTVESAKRSLN
ncbi:bifunctional methylenetetrahydrofolate dehydrogenase/methenyltetrahydrofolate cyclohydrolase FolD [Effusibacillus lacus]|uniref:Bifunctional protein FolD n=1 Tax=Effusibacillus lacus TaxID=1348429 RepID=A0A292YQY9_9BACL|nr:bifunctional methylenetetrahydrofolate dehydrogenase/methenyltetrahydrofolate cyclohydrolase FolD [Effusibacillus lacus]TCS72520.1 methylenetetrahydrofolate dehydrogenase (NADP+)/methenyltetrahydrofolate cyclohydrolase [Effusibacillus lacus]GAX90915.1 bifunctional 5,10-methylene-tetrahydrofolate dehydrogenase/5,10-methylene-tetrahydrofolate cyclohydrolase [Effusibacillus lacus]